MKAAELFIRCLENEGVEYIFGIPGEENLDVMDALLDSSIRFITVRHEQGAVHAAEGYARSTGKPEKVLDKIVEGRISKFYTEACLLEQPFVKDTAISVRDHIAAHIQKIGENIQVRRFVRFKLGE